MSRRTLEAITVDKGQANGSLKQRLDALVATGQLHQSLADWATEVRLGGNLGAHFDPLTQVTETDARQLLDFVRELCRFLYTIPAELARRRTARQP